MPKWDSKLYTCIRAGNAVQGLSDNSVCYWVFAPFSWQQNSGLVLCDTFCTNVPIKLSELLAMYWQANNLLEHVVHKHCTITKYCIITKHIWNKVPKSHPVNWAWLKTTIPSWTLWARDIRIQWGSSLGPGPRPQSDDSTHSLVPWSDPARVWQNLVYYM